MNYQATPKDYPSESEIADLVDYVSGDLRLVTASGVSATEDDLDGFRHAGHDQDVSYLHTFSFSENYDPDVLGDRVRVATNDCRDGESLIAVHDGVYGNRHVHVAEVGSRDRVAMDVSDIVEYREAVCDRFDAERIGSAEP